MYSRGHLLYIGQTNDVLRRFREHAETKAWWVQVDKILIEDFDSAEALDEAERQAIKTEKPLHNVIHARRTSEWAQRQARLDEALRELAGRGFGVSGGERIPAGTPEAGDELWLDRVRVTVLAAWGSWAWIHFRQTPVVKLVHLPTVTK